MAASSQLPLVDLCGGHFTTVVLFEQRQSFSSWCFYLCHSILFYSIPLYSTPFLCSHHRVICGEKSTNRVLFLMLRAVYELVFRSFDRARLCAELKGMLAQRLAHDGAVVRGTWQEWFIILFSFVHMWV